MIGVIADSSDHDVVREFFELFKTPWEFYGKDGEYDVLLSTGERPPENGAKLVLCYAGRQTRFDSERKIQVGRQRTRSCILSYEKHRIPIYGETITFAGNESRLLRDEDSQECVAFLHQSNEGALARIGYDLFNEIRMLLTVGQPPANANLPALELHIALLRDSIIGSGISLVEIPPVPEGYRFVVCLTHDVDHPSIRQHKWDRTMFGFLYRAIFGSLQRIIHGRISIRDLFKNWAAALKLPFIYLGLAKDFWREFDELYLDVEKRLPTTYFVIPFKNRSGNNSHGSAPALRAARYGAEDIADTIRNLKAVGCEIALHGIDAWADSSSGRVELEEIQRVTGETETGVRMHWLYYDQHSPAALEQGGAAYDSSIGYNETVGYRAGTTQVYKPLQAARLLELPLHVMDTALFYSAYLNLSQKLARILLDRMANNAVRFGGCLTINWHDRSLAPERLWSECYRELIEDLKTRGAWFATAREVVDWFGKRRSAVFETACVAPTVARARVESDGCDNLPGLRLRIHRSQGSLQNRVYGSEEYTDVPVAEGVDRAIPVEASR